MFNHAPTYMSVEKAEELAAKLKAEDDDGWIYSVERRGRFAVVVVKINEADDTPIGYL